MPVNIGDSRTFKAEQTESMFHFQNPADANKDAGCSDVPLSEAGEAERMENRWAYNSKPTSADQMGNAISEAWEKSTAQIFRQLIEEGVTSPKDIAEEMGIPKGQVSKLAKRAMAEGWLKKEGRDYALTGQA